jgi:hypothetical protein
MAAIVGVPQFASLFEGPVPAVRENSADDAAGSPGRVCVFATEREAQVEIVRKMPSPIHPLQSFWRPWRIDFRMTNLDF